MLTQVGGLQPPSSFPKQANILSAVLRKSLQSLPALGGGGGCFLALYIKVLIILPRLPLLIHKMFIECLVCAQGLGSGAEQT